MTREQRAFKVVADWLRENPEMKTAIQQGLNGPLGNLAEIVCVAIGEAEVEERRACKEIVKNAIHDSSILTDTASIKTAIKKIEMRGEAE